MSDISLATAASDTLARADVNSARAIDVAVSSLRKSFGAAEVFRDVSFTIERGEAVALVGANGTGKSTLLRCLMGLIAPSAGTIAMFGQQVTGASARKMRALRGDVGLVSQKHNLVPRLSVLTNVIHGLLGQRSGIRHYSHVLAPADSRHAAAEALQKVGLSDLALRRADRLSGGQSQRVAIARALVGNPRLVIADEPCASLDPAAGEEVMALFFRLAREEGVSVVFTSHNVDHALTYGDRVLGLAGGQLRLDAAAASLTHALLRDVYD